MLFVKLCKMIYLRILQNNILFIMSVYKFMNNTSLVKQQLSEIKSASYEYNENCSFIVDIKNIREMKNTISESVNLYNELEENKNEISSKITQIKTSLDNIQDNINSNTKIDTTEKMNNNVNDLVTQIANYNRHINNNHSYDNLRNIEFGIKGKLVKDGTRIDGEIKQLNLIDATTVVYHGNENMTINIRDICTESTLQNNN